MFGPVTTRLVELEERQRTLDAERAGLLVEWVRDGEWADDGSVTPAARLARDTAISGVVARERVRVSALLATAMPVTNEAAAMLGWPKIKLLANAINPRTAAFFARDEATLVEQAARLTADQLAVLLRHWMHLVDEDGANADADSQHDGQYLSITTSFDGQVFVKGRFDPESGAVLKSVIEQISDELYRSERREAMAAKLQGEEPAPARGSSERAADAAVEMARRAAATTAAAEAGARVVPAQPLVTVHMDVDHYADVKARLADGTPMARRSRRGTRCAWRAMPPSCEPSPETAPCRCTSAGPYGTQRTRSARRCRCCGRRARTRRATGPSPGASSTTYGTGSAVGRRTSTGSSRSAVAITTCTTRASSTSSEDPTAISSSCAPMAPRSVSPVPRSPSC